MPQLSDILMMAMLPALLVVSGFVSGSETALFSLSRHAQRRLAKSTTFADRTISTLLAETRDLLITLLLTNMTVNVAYFVIVTVLLMRLQSDYGLGPIGTAVGSVTTLVALIILGEVLPKLAAARVAAAWSRWAAVPLWMLHRLLSPLRRTLSFLVIAPLARLIAPRERPPSLSNNELDTLVELSRHKGVIDRGEERMLQQVLELGQLKVRDLMIPRVDITAFDLSRPAKDLITLLRASHHSRVPVFRRNLDGICGVLHTREVLLARPTTRAGIARLIRQINYIPELQAADQLLIHFRKTGTTTAIAVDEYGGTAGLVTLEDLVEHMVGEIADSHEPSREAPVQTTGPGRWRVSANLPIHEWSDAYGQPWDPKETGAPAGTSTLGGMLTAKLGHWPRVGDAVEVGGVRFEVQTMKGRRIGWLNVRTIETDSADGEHRQ